MTSHFYSVSSLDTEEKLKLFRLIGSIVASLTSSYVPLSLLASQNLFAKLRMLANPRFSGRSTTEPCLSCMYIVWR